MTFFLEICFGSNAKGQGFGLGVVKRLTEALNGSVTPKNEIGKGSKFAIRHCSAFSIKKNWKNS